MPLIPKLGQIYLSILRRKVRGINVLFSCLLHPAQVNYDVGNQLLASRFALEEWQHWLEGAVIVWTNHKNFAYLQKAKTLNAH